MNAYTVCWEPMSHKLLALSHARCHSVVSAIRTPLGRPMLPVSGVTRWHLTSLPIS